MSQETLEWLQENTRIGFTDKRGPAWHAARGADGEYLNHFPGPIPLEEAEALMDYELVEGEPTVNALTDSGVLSVVDDKRKAIVRADTGQIFGYFSKGGYQIHRPKQWLLDEVSRILDTSNSDLGIGTVALLRGGGQAFIQFELPETFTTSHGGVEHRPYLTSATSHDGSMSTTYITGTTVAVCDNTLSLALTTAATKFKVRHSANSLGKLAQVRSGLDIVIEEAADLFDQEVNQLLDEAVSTDRWRDFLDAYTNPTGRELEGRAATMVDHKRATLNRLWNYDKRVAPWSGTAFGVLSAVNTYVHHEQAVKSMGRVERNMGRMISGEFDKIDASTLRLLARV